MTKTTTTPRKQQPAPSKSPVRSLLLLALVGVLGLVAVVWFNLGRGDEAPAVEETVPMVSRLVGSEQVAAVEGEGGEVTLRVVAEVPATTGSLPTVPLGVPVTLRFTADDAAGGDELPQLSASVVAGGAESGEAAQGVVLDRQEILLLDNTDGELVLPVNLDRSGGDAAEGGHNHAAEPGRSLTAGMPGGGFVWAAKLQPEPSAVAAHESGRWLALANADAGEVQVVDLMRREQPVTIAVEGSPQVLAFRPGAPNELWVADPAGSSITVIDTAAAAVTGTAQVEAAPAAVVFDAEGASALVAGGDEAALLDANTLAELDRTALPAEAVSADFTSAADSFAVAHPSGTLSVLAAGDGELGEPTSLAVGDAGSETSTIAVAPDGRFAVAVNSADDTATVVDLEDGSVVETVDTGSSPDDVAFLDKFAVVRNTQSPDVTWIDLEDPRTSDNLALGESPTTQVAGSVDGAEVLAVSPEDGWIYRLHAMMGRPMVMDQEPNGFGADSVIEIRQGLSETTPGVFEQRTVLDQPGTYQLELTLPDGSVARFDIETEAASEEVVAIAPTTPNMEATVGDEVSVSFTMSTGTLPANAEILGYTTGPQGTSQVRAPAVADGDTFTGTVEPPGPGTYILWLVSEEAGISAGTGEPTVLEVTE